MGLAACVPPCVHRLLAPCFRAAAGADARLEVAAHVAGVSRVGGTLGPVRMMLCKPDLSDKHERWFRVNADDATLEWAAQAAEGGLLVRPTKGPFRVRPPELVCTANALLSPVSRYCPSLPSSSPPCSPSSF